MDVSDPSGKGRDMQSVSIILRKPCLKSRSNPDSMILWIAILLLWFVGLNKCLAEEKVDYNRDIKPILSNHCFACHGPSEKSREADLRLDERNSALETKAIVPGKTKESVMIQRILSNDPEEIMPPSSTKKPLTEKQKKLLGQWIEQGAGYQQHWSFIKPLKAKPPTVKQKEWPRNPIDIFVLKKLEEAGLQPSPEAERATLIRRISLDLTGLPPTLSDLDRFLNLKDENWYEQMVDHYLSRPAYGERMSLAWMDAARYGDTSVFHADGPRDMWPWRDWVINAYNENMPFDQFTIEQIAGDLIPNATPWQKVASGFNRNHATTDEGGAIAEEWRIDYVVDRVKTTSNVWLGISMECGQCHEHKFDPISQKEYYGFFAFFNNTTDPGMQTRRGNQSPVVNVPDKDRDAEIADREEELAALKKSLEQHQKDHEADFQKWLKEASAKARSGEKTQPPSDLLASFNLDENKGNKPADSIDTKRKAVVRGKPIWTAGKFGSGFQLDGKNFIEVPNLGDFERTDSFSYGCWVKPKGNPNGAALAKMNGGNSFRGWDLLVSNGSVSVHLINTWSSNAIKVTTKKKIPADKWTHLFATYDGSSKAAGVKIYINGKSEPWNIEADALKGTMKTKVPLKIGRRNNSSQFRGIVDDVKFYNRALSDSEVAALAGNDPITPLLALDEKKRTPAQTKTLSSHYWNTIDQSYGKLTKEQAKLSSTIEGLKKKTITSMIMQDQPKMRNTYVLMRGHYASPDKKEVISPDVPKIFPPLDEKAPRNRLGLAEWLVSDDHPLTSRVTVNRYWTMIFGHGLVATPMDFGSQGAWPTHPELLDWLAVDFRENGWNVKRMLKQILMSSTYRQSSRMTAELAEKDPQNLLLGRGPRFRLQGEIIRDSALAMSGLLVDQVGGPGVKPYQPPGLWNEVALTGNVRFVQDKGEKLYRKSMYIYWKRSAPHPGMRILDAPTREKCVVQRPRTNTPLQALYLMNDVQYIEAARHLAERMMKEGGKTAAERIQFGYRLMTSHAPSERSLKTLLKLYETELAHYKQNSEAATELLSQGESKRDENLDLIEHAAWTVVANVLLNMDATLTRF